MAKYLTKQRKLLLDFLSEHTNIFASKGEARRMLKDNGVSINKNKVKEDLTVTSDLVMNGHYILVQKGKKNYYIVHIA